MKCLYKRSTGMFKLSFLTVNDTDTNFLLNKEDFRLQQEIGWFSLMKKLSDSSSYLAGSLKTNLSLEN